jgi:DNA-binding MarR family transcriptional regulator
MSMNYEKNIGRYIGRLNSLLTRKLNQINEKEKTGITADQFRLLAQLWQKDGLNQQELACALGRDRASVTRMVDLLEKEAFLSRSPDNDDRRVNLIFLTKKGRELELKASGCAKGCLNTMLRDFSDADEIQLKELLVRAIDNLEK